jgi:leucyl aminopeptidase
MRVEVADAFPEADVLAIPVGPNGIPAGGDIAGAARIAEEEDVGAKAGRTAVLYAEEPSKRFVLVGLGPADELDADTVRTAAAAVAGATERIGGTIAWLLVRSSTA